VYDQFVPDDTDPSPLRRAINPIVRTLFSDVTRQLGPLLNGTPLAVERRE